MPVFPATTAASVFTVGYLINRTFDLLLGADREELSQLVTSIDGIETQFAVNYPMSGLSQGTYLAIDDEIMYVWQVSEASGISTEVTVQRGMKGTLASSHQGSSIIQVNPPFTKAVVRKTLQDEIRSWGPQVFQVKSEDVAAQQYVRGYDLGSIAPFFFVLDVKESALPTGFDGTPSDQDWRSLAFDVEQSADTSAFPSGSALTIIDPHPLFDTPRTLHVVYAAPFSVDATFLDNDSLIDMGVDSSDVDIVPYGAAWRLATSREVRRSLFEAQGQASDLQAYPPGYLVKIGQEFKELRDSRLSDAAQRLRSMYPIRRIV